MQVEYTKWKSSKSNFSVEGEVMKFVAEEGKVKVKQYQHELQV